MTLYDGDGRPFAAGARLGGGGEGSVYAVGSDRVVKIYRAPLSPQRFSKIRSLGDMNGTPVREVAAWPLRGAYDAQRRPVGFVMPRVVSAKAIAVAANPQARKRAFPQASWGWLAHVGRNLAVAVDALHAEDLVIGDVNESNVLVGSDARVRFIDVDSFQLTRGGVRHSCDVGTPMYQPPELQGRTFSGLPRLPQHDRFGLAVLLFQLLFMGRHPWAGCVAGGPELSFEGGEFIARLPFAYGREAARAGFSPPSDGVQMDWLPPDLQMLFDRAFSKNGAQERPSGSQWAAALDAFEAHLASCRAVATHQFPAPLERCPWCRLERSDRPYFIGARHAVTRETLDIAEIERLLAEVPTAGSLAVPAEPSSLAVVGEPLGPGLIRHKRLWEAELGASGVAVAAAVHWLALGVAEAIVAFLIVLVFVTRPPLGSVRADRRKRLTAAQAAFNENTAAWQHIAATADIGRKHAELVHMLERYKSLPAKHQAERQALERSRERLQLDALLEGAIVSQARIWKIGRRTRAALAAFGVETAKDVEYRLPFLEIPGIKDSKRRALERWVDGLKRGFRFDPTLPVDPSAVAALERAQAQERSMLERHLRGGPQALAREAADVRVSLANLGARLDLLARELAQARADYLVAR